MKRYSDNIQGIFWIILAMFIFSFQNIAIKFINSGYPVLEIVIIRSLVALPLTLWFFRMEGRRGWPEQSTSCWNTAVGSSCSFPTRPISWGWQRYRWPRRPRSAFQRH